MKTKYTIWHYKSNTFMVIATYVDGWEDIPFKGSLSDCEAYVKLKRGTDIEFKPHENTEDNH